MVLRRFSTDDCAGDVQRGAEQPGGAKLQRFSRGTEAAVQRWCRAGGGAEQVVVQR